MAKPPVEVTLQWTRDLVFDTTIASGAGPVIDSDGVAGASPVQALAGFTMEYVVSGPVPAAAISRAVDLSREKYCSVWHSLRPDTPLDIRITRIDG